MVRTSQPTLGVHLLETITTGMYSEPLHSVREYVQNAYDSIRAARRRGLLGPKEGEISVIVDRDSRTVRIRDDGTGLDPEEAVVRLLDLGSSNKAESDSESVQNAGFRGIGRMAGITYCRTLRFETSGGDGKKCVVEFDAAGINSLTRVRQKPTTIIKAIQKNSKASDESEARGKRYMEVILEGINEPGSIFLDENRLQTYLSQVAPVAYAQVWPFEEKIQAIADDAESAWSLEHVKLTIRDTEGNTRFDVRRPFKETFGASNQRGKSWRVQVEDVVALPRTEKEGAGWWGWLALHERRGALGNVPYAGLRIRMHNIGIGETEILKDLFPTQSHALWCFGEIHIIDHRLKPNAQRDNFEDSKKWNVIKEQLRAEAVRISREIHAESSQRSKSVPEFDRRARRIVQKADHAMESGFVSRSEKSDLIEQINGQVGKLKQEEKRKSRTEDERDALGKIRRDLEDAANRARKVKHTKADKAQAHLSREGRRVFRKIDEILKSELDKDNYRRIAEKIYSALQTGEGK